ncbi:MAG: tryptophan--tRNA ligase [Candidatus Magasanikbacteria bacterium]
MSKPVIVSGIQPTGNLHLGNYLGAIKNWVDLQNSGKYTMYIFIADLHALAGNMEAEERRAQVTRTVAELLAAGIDPRKTTLFVQSHVTGHTELGWIFNCITPVAELERMTQFKDKSLKQAKNINMGLLDYPVLQAADILLYHGNFVPVGEDQIQHVELTRDTARWFNNRFGEYFAEVKPLLTEVPKVKSLLDPEKKMSKSLGGGHVIELADEPEVIERKIKKAVTATEGGEKSSGVANLLLLLKQFGTKEQYTLFSQAEKDGSIRYGDLKKALIEVLSLHFADFRQKRKEYMDHREKIAEILDEGRRRAQEVADDTLAKVHEFVGLR